MCLFVETNIVMKNLKHYITNICAYVFPTMSNRFHTGSVQDYHRGHVEHMQAHTKFDTPKI